MTALPETEPPLVFYEVILSDCEGLNCTLHVWSNGAVDRVKGTAYAQRKLLPLFHDPEAPTFVTETINRLQPTHAAKN